MFHTLLRDARFFLALLQFDQDLADEVGSRPCRWCGGPLYGGDYPRKPRWVPAEALPGYGRRFSFCCGREGCRRRSTPPSVRFFGRKVYVGAMVVLVSAMRHGPTRWRLRQLWEWFGIPARTVERWCAFWREIFRASPFWRATRGHFVPAVAEAELPRSVLDRFVGDDERRLTHLLRLLSPITTSLPCSDLASCKGLETRRR